MGGVYEFELNSHILPLNDKKILGGTGCINIILHRKFNVWTSHEFVVEFFFLEHMWGVLKPPNSYSLNQRGLLNLLCWSTDDPKEIKSKLKPYIYWIHYPQPRSDTSGWKISNRWIIEPWLWWYQLLEYKLSNYALNLTDTYKKKRILDVIYE